MIEPVDYDYDDISGGALIKVVGVGGGGGNAVNHMVANMIQNDIGGTLLGVDELAYPMSDDNHGKIIFYAVNTDAQALRKSNVQKTVQIGGETTKGLGAGANPNVGRKAAEDDQDAIRAMLEGADMVFIAAGMGGGTGTGAAPIVAQIAKELGILTVAVVTKPFSFEGKKRMHFAELGIKELSKHVDSLIIIPNEKLLKVLGKNISLINAFAAANDILRNAVTGISDMITSPGLINVDFADVRTVMSEMGRAMMGSGVVQGTAADGRAEKAAQEAVASPLLEDVDLSGARGVLVNVTAGFDLTLDEFSTVGETIRSFASEEATVVVGTTLVPEMSDEIRVTIVATGIGDIERQDVQIMSTSPLNEPVKPVEQQHIRPEPRHDLDTPITERLKAFRPVDPTSFSRD
ncbi:cell division protein FtsZ [Histophilus somni]|uniref:Cell division protein FtsZ n=1 Tax=Histophilus somni TaxID=731 RepID=A0A9Q6YZY9_HISSO|nr:cell division protein FtsZ [Histophilus somni]ACA32289.1 cell division protein FtsZ [Histophilus somni 2336]ARU65406.1 cell division protein FtsZ [Histophilus somni]ARU67273.1 cell division protein FtsZ [Histophilus somni]ARU69150.1 cell division protein FtsZ [Histophilus somni]ARU71029.1 cell division protein FtsZ [Histophilus somni]